MIDMAVYVTALIYLAVSDIKHLAVPLFPSIGLFIFGIIRSLISSGGNVGLVVLGCVPAIVFLIFLILRVSVLEAGDILIIAGIGAAFGIIIVCVMLLFASVICLLYLMISKCIVRKKLKEKIAFVPFIGIGMVISWLSVR